MGEILAELALQGQTRHNIDFIRLNDKRPGQKELLHAFHTTGADVEPAPPALTSKL